MEEKICSVFGHRSIEITEELYATVTAAILDAVSFGCRIFYFGGFGAFDALCYKIVTKIKEEKPALSLRRVYCVAQERYLRKSVRYFRREDYDEVVYLTPSFEGWYKSIYFRNCAMIDASDAVIFYAEARESSGAYKAYKYAAGKKGKKTVNLWQMLSDKDKNSAEYRKMEDDVKKQEARSKDMGKECTNKLRYEQKTDKLEDLKAENSRLADKMNQAANKGDTKAYDAARQQYETNIKAQDALSRQMKENGIPHENTTTQQNIQKQHLDNNMADKFAEKMQRQTDKGKEPSKADKEQYDKYMKQTRQSEQENLKRYDDKKLDNMKNYGLSEEEINKERKEMEHQRERYR